MATLALVTVAINVALLPINLHLLGLVRWSDYRRAWRSIWK